ncbi:helix-turn-helix domain-containing protein, partial [Paenibacillus glacialis]|uniref:helix-turn-helix domain-containing protein n=1 Tax=Paenibacillus glacialis TaxID=494026 RepID=UPI000B24090F
MGYTHFSITERSKLELLLKMRWSTRAIAKELGRHHASIAREIKRGRFNQEDVTRSH